MKVKAIKLTTMKLTAIMGISCTVSHIKTQRNFSVKSFNPAVISDIKIDGKSLISATGFNSLHCSRFQYHRAKLLKYVMY